MSTETRYLRRTTFGMDHFYRQQDGYVLHLVGHFRLINRFSIDHLEDLIVKEGGFTESTENEFNEVLALTLDQLGLAKLKDDPGVPGLINVLVGKVDLTNMVAGCTPRFEFIEELQTRKLGEFTGGMADCWRWNRRQLAELSENELFELYQILTEAS